MDFLAFCDSLSAPSLKAVALHWNAARGSKMMPAWTDIRPQAISAQLSIVWSFKYDRTTGIFVCRLAGDRIAQIFKKNLRGVSLAEVQPADSFEAINAILMRVLREPAVYRGGGRVFKQDDHYLTGERIILPLSADGETGDSVLGATDYKAPYIPNIPGGTMSENAEWFSLRS
jgi:hypothetical protein